MSLLPGSGVIAYNGFTFDPSTTATRSMSVTPVPSADRRTVTENHYQITIRTVIAGRPTDAAVQLAMKLLTKPAGAFQYTGHGLPLTINFGPRARDTAWGPWPKLVTFRPIGSENACEIVWQVEFRTPECDDAVFSGPAELSVGLTFEVDRSGLTKRTCKGFVRIAVTRRSADDRTVPDSADYYREKVTPDPVPGFRRESQSFTLSDDRAKLDFTFVDAQMGLNIPPPGVVDIPQADHTVTSSQGWGWMKWTHNFAFTYELARDGKTGPAAARDHFVNKVVKDRLDQARKIRTADGRPVVVLKNQFTAAEVEMFGTKTLCRFQAMYDVVGADLTAMLAGSGLWRKAGDDWRLWWRSIGGFGPLGPRGSAKLVFDVGSDDKIIDLCAPPAGPGLVELGNRPAGPTPGFNELNTPVDRELKSLTPAPTPESSWVAYRNAVHIEADDGTVLVKTLPSGDFEGPSPTGFDVSLSTGSAFPRGSGAAPVAGLEGFAGGILENRSGRGETTAQRRTSPTVFLVMRGECLRLGFPIPCPALVSVGGVTPVAMNRLDRGEGFVQSVVANYGWALYGGAWSIRYLVEDSLENPFPFAALRDLVPGNPLLGR